MLRKTFISSLALALILQNAPALLAQQLPAENAHPQTVQEYRDRARMDAAENKNLPLKVGGLLIGVSILGGAMTVRGFDKYAKKQMTQTRQAQENAHKILTEKLENIFNQSTQSSRGFMRSSNHHLRYMSERLKNLETNQNIILKQLKTIQTELPVMSVDITAQVTKQDPYIVLLKNKSTQEIQEILPVMLKRDFPQLNAAEIKELYENIIKAHYNSSSNYLMIASLRNTAEKIAVQSPTRQALETLCRRLVGSKTLVAGAVLAGGALVAAQAQNTLSQKMQRLWENPQLLLVMSDEDAELFEQNQEAKNMVITISNAYRALSEMTPQEQDFFLRQANFENGQQMNEVPSLAR